MVGMRQAISQGTVSVPNNNICISPGSQGAFAWVKAMNDSRVGRSQRYELVGSYLTRLHPGCPQHRQPVADPRQAVRNLCKIIASQLFAREGHRLAIKNDRFGPIKEKWAVIGGDGLQDTA